MNSLQVNNNQQSFKGAFLINYKRAIPGLQEGFETIVGQHKRQIFRNFNGDKNSVLYVMKNSKDYDVAQFAARNEMKFKYMPDVDTRCRFDEELPEEVVDYMSKNKPTVIDKVSELLDYVAQNRFRCRARKDSHIDRHTRFMNNMGFDFKGEGKTNSRGVTLFIDEKTGKKAVISPKTNSGFRFVAIKPPKKSGEPEIYATTVDGKIVEKFEFPNELLRFRASFKKAIREHLHLDK